MTEHEYRLRIYGAGEDGNTPPHADQPLLLQMTVHGYEGVGPAWPADAFRPTDVHLTVTRGQVPAGAFHSSRTTTSANVFESSPDQPWLDVWPWVRQYEGLRAEWERMDDDPAEVAG